MYKTVIGLEVHCELKSKSKVFSKGRNAYSEEVNTNVNVVDLGMPGILPNLNKYSVYEALLLASHLNCELASRLVFDRKNYFYPDLPKGYQITQSHMPFGVNGKFKIYVGEEEKEILIHDIHLEEDTASIDHYSSFSLLDYNRCGTPLIEIVTEPCMYSKEEALAFLDYLRHLFLYLDVAEARIDKGQIRCDVNVSLMKENDTKLGTKVEVKNVNSITGVKETIEYEVKRQTELLNQGKKIKQETRRYDDSTKTTISMRSKEDALDYKYFIEPNIPNVKIDESLINEVLANKVELQFDRIKKYVSSYNISFKDANLLAKDKDISNYFEELLTSSGNIQSLVNLLNNVILSYLNKSDKSILEISVKPDMLVNLIKKVEEGNITSKQAKEVLTKALEEDKDPIVLIKELNITSMNNTEELIDMANKIIDNNPSMVLKYKEGRNVLDFFIGQVMKETKGRANPSATSKIFKDLLEKR